jgi:hypothetical protein
MLVSCCNSIWCHNLKEHNLKCELLWKTVKEERGRTDKTGERLLVLKKFLTFLTHPLWIMLTTWPITRI